MPQPPEALAPELFFLAHLHGLSRGLAPGLKLYHPFLLEQVEGAAAVLASLRCAQDALAHPLGAELLFQAEDALAVSWHGGPVGREIQGVTLASLDAQGRINVLRIGLRPVQRLAAWRARLQASVSEAGHALPPALRPDETSLPIDPVDPRLPLPLSQSVLFHGPAFVKPVSGAAAVSHVLGHARAVYGECTYGPVLQQGRHVLRAFTSRLPLEILSIAHLDEQGQVDEWAAYMQPWPAAMLFLERLRTSLDGHLDDSYYEDHGVAHETNDKPTREDTVMASRPD